MILDTKYKIQNTITKDEFGRKNGILLVNKPKGKTSHDIVDEVRREFETRKVGHAGALDPFAEGLLIILVGKATKKSNEFLNLDKTYEADILIGVSTDSGDIEGTITKVVSKMHDLKTGEVNSVLDSFIPGYSQYVPVFSSVKVNGDKLRVLARKFHHHEIVLNDKKEKEVVFFDEDKNEKMRINLPVKDIKISKIDLFSLEKLKSEKVIQDYLDQSEKYEELGKEISNLKEVYIAKIRIDCSKGTYIRQLAIDIGEKIGQPAMLVGLKRTRIGEFRLEDVEAVN